MTKRKESAWTPEFLVYLLFIKGVKDDMNAIWLKILAAFGIGIYAGYVLFYKKAYQKGVKDRENEIFTDYVVYMPLHEVTEMVEEMIEEDGESPDSPILIVRPEKYDYIDGYGFDISKFDLK